MSDNSYRVQQDLSLLIFGTSAFTRIPVGACMKYVIPVRDEWETASNGSEETLTAILTGATVLVSCTESGISMPYLEVFLDIIPP